MNRIITLHILNAMYYERCDSSFSSLLTSISKRDPGFDAVAIFSFKLNEEVLDIQLDRIGIHSTPPSLLPDNPQNPEGMVVIKEGAYSFMQMPIIDEERIKLELLPFINGKKEGTIFIRIFKESLFEEVMQFMMPL